MPVVTPDIHNGAVEICYSLADHTHFLSHSLSVPVSLMAFAPPMHLFTFNTYITFDGL